MIGMPLDLGVVLLIPVFSHSPGGHGFVECSPIFYSLEQFFILNFIEPKNVGNTCLLALSSSPRESVFPLTFSFDT